MSNRIVFSLVALVIVGLASCDGTGSDVMMNDRYVYFNNRMSGLVTVAVDDQPRSLQPGQSTEYRVGIAPLRMYMHASAQRQYTFMADMRASMHSVTYTIRPDGTYDTNWKSRSMMGF